MSTDDPPIVLTVAGSDPSGGAGLQADLKTIHRHGGYGAAVPSLLTVQNTLGVQQVELISPSVIVAQLCGVLDDMLPGAAKTGALGSPAAVSAVGGVARTTSFPWVVDPVSMPSRGVGLSDKDLTPALRSDLIPHATLVTPNALEASQLAEMPVRSLDEACEAATRIAALGPRAVLVTGGHLDGTARGTDVLLCDGKVDMLVAKQVVPGEFHGIGCALSAAIATRLAFGESITAAVSEAKTWLEAALGAAFSVGKGARPVNHF